MINKKDGSSRFCVDYRRLNEVTQQDQFPLPRIDDILDRLSGSTWFTALDLKSGYWQVQMHPDSIAKTAFSTPDGHYEFLRLPFGLKNAPADFSRVMHQAFGHLDFIQIYLDDITIHSKSFEQHIQHISEVFKILQHLDLRINWAKCAWCQRKVQLLGHIVSYNTVQMDPSKIVAIKEMQAPKTIKQIQQFLGLCGYYRRFIHQFSHITQPLYALLKKDTEWKWSKECQDAFQLLISKMVDYPILRQPQMDRPFTIFTDASSTAIGAVLSQHDDDGSEYVCAYGSRLLKGAELHYGITEKECLAVLWAIRHYRIYVFETHFTVVTDHSALTWLMKITDPTGRLARWSIYLQAFSFTIIHRKGLKHSNVDALSRPILLSSADTTVATKMEVTGMLHNQMVRHPIKCKIQ